MKRNLNEIYVVLKKEYYELLHTSIKFLLIMMLPFLSSGLIAIQDGSGGALSPTINILCSFLFSSFFSTILIRDSIVREKDESTLQMLLLSKFNLFNVIVGKVFLCVIVGMLFQTLQTILMYIIMYNLGSSMLYLFNIKVFIILPLVTYIMGSVVLLVSVLIDDKKTSEFISMFLALIIGSIIMILYSFILNNIIFIIAFLVIIVVLNIELTLFLKKIIVNSMFFIKK